MTSTKQYVAAAEIIAYRLGRAQSVDEQLGIREVATDLARMFADDNPRFDRDRFTKACRI